MRSIPVARGDRIVDNCAPRAGMAELVDARDSKSRALKGVPVRFRLPAPRSKSIVVQTGPSTNQSSNPGWVSGVVVVRAKSRRCKQVPLTRNPFQDVATTVGEADPGSGDEILLERRRQRQWLPWRLLRRRCWRSTLLRTLSSLNPFYRMRARARSRRRSGCDPWVTGR
jgi:hypothetical protein